MLMPTTVQIRSRHHVPRGNASVIPRQTTAPLTHVTGAHGTRKGRGASGRVLRSTSTPRQTTAKASRMPIEINSPSTSSGKMPAKKAAMSPVATVATWGVR